MAISIYLDANFIIRLVESHHGQNLAHERLWDMVDAGRLTAATSWLTWSEVLVHPLRNGDDALVDVYDRFFAGETAALACHEVERTTLRHAAGLRADYPRSSRRTRSISRQRRSRAATGSSRPTRASPCCHGSAI